MPLVLTANTVPWPQLPPPDAVPYRVSPDKSNPAYGLAPSLLVKLGSEPDVAVKLCRFVKPMPSVLTANTVPFPELPPWSAVPYRVLPDKINPAWLPTLYRFVNPVPSVLTANTVPEPIVLPCHVVPYRLLPDKSNLAYGKAPSLL